MPDYDVFAKSLPKPWRQAARQALENDDNPLVVKSILDALQSEMPLVFTAFPDVIDSIVYALTQARTTNAVARVEAELEEMVRAEPAQGRHVLRDSAMAVLHDPNVGVEMDRHQVAGTVLAHFAARRVSPNILVRRLLEEGRISLPEFIDRKAHLVARLRESEDIQMLAADMMSLPTGVALGINQQSFGKSSRKPSQDEILSFELTR